MCLLLRLCVEIMCMCVCCVVFAFVFGVVSVLDCIVFCSGGVCVRSCA